MSQKGRIQNWVSQNDELLAAVGFVLAISSVVIAIIASSKSEFEKVGVSGEREGIAEIHIAFRKSLFIAPKGASCVFQQGLDPYSSISLKKCQVIENE